MDKDHRKVLVGKFLLLMVFWIIAVGEIDQRTITLGMVSCFFCAWFFKDFLLTRDLRFKLNVINLGRLLKYIFHLILEVVKANVQVAMIVLSPSMNISPTFIRYQGLVKKEATKAILGNSITLTPGTLTVEITGDEYVVHGLTKGHAEGMLDWYMVDQLLTMEGED